MRRRAWPFGPRLRWATVAGVISVLFIAYYRRRVTEAEWLLKSSKTASAAVRRGLAGIRDFRRFRVSGWWWNRHMQLVALTAMTALDTIHSPIRRDQLFSVSLDWYAPSTSAIADAETVVLYLGGITGSPKECNAFMKDLLQKKKTWVGASMNRRGHAEPLTSPCFNVFGNTEDLSLVVRHAREVCPRAKIALVGSSAGSALMIRYMGEHPYDSGVDVAVGISPGYDIDELWPKLSAGNNAVYDSYLAYRLREVFWRPNADVLSSKDPRAAARMGSASTVWEFVQASAAFLHPHQDGPTTTYGEWLEKTCPLRVAPAVRVPTLCISARDDPICDVDLVETVGYELAETNEHAVLAVVEFGSHCAFLDENFDRWSFELAFRWCDAILTDAPT